MPQPVIVVGSLNMDFVARVGTLPRAGETVAGDGFQMIPGGKGANQACAAARLGGRVRMIGRVGDDVFGDELRRSLQRSGVDVGAVMATPATPTGVALIFVDARGENVIVVSPGANGELAAKDVERELEHAERGFLLLQLETPMPTVTAAASLAHWRGLTVVLDPAPARALPRELLTSIDILTPNECEALTLLGRDGSTIAPEDAPEAARAIRALGVGTVVLKLGAHGAFVAGPTVADHFPAPRVDVVDATAAGDTFNGALAVALAEGKGMAAAIAFANTAAALSVTVAGAQSSIPTRASVDARMSR